MSSGLESRKVTESTQMKLFALAYSLLYGMKHILIPLSVMIFQFFLVTLSYALHIL